MDFRGSFQELSKVVQKVASSDKKQSEQQELNAKREHEERITAVRQLIRIVDPVLKDFSKAMKWRIERYNKDVKEEGMWHIYLKPSDKWISVTTCPYWTYNRASWDTSWCEEALPLGGIWIDLHAECESARQAGILGREGGPSFHLAADATLPSGFYHQKAGNYFRLGYLLSVSDLTESSLAKVLEDYVSYLVKFRPFRFA